MRFRGFYSLFGHFLDKPKNFGNRVSTFGYDFINRKFKKYLAYITIKKELKIMSKTVLTTKKARETFKVRNRRLEYRTQEFTEEEYDYTIDFAFNGFIWNREQKGCAKTTLEDYKRFYKRFSEFIEWTGSSVKDTPIALLTKFEGLQGLFKKYRQNIKGITNIQTINHDLRNYRAFGNFCEEEGYIDGFKCPIREVEPTIKSVYTVEELKKLLVKPNKDNFEEYRNYTVIIFLCSTGARCNTILNIKLTDIDLEEGTVIFNTVKTKKPTVMFLDDKAKRDIKEFINYWGYASKDGYLFFNRFGEQLTRGGLSKAIASYNKSRGVEKTSIHLFRHTYAKMWVESNEGKSNMYKLQRVLGHSDLEMTKRYYALYDKDIKEAVNQHSIMAQMRTRSGDTIKSIRNNQKLIAI